MRVVVSIVMLALGAAGCDGDGGRGPTSTAATPPVCQARPDGTASGCFASPSSRACSPNGCQSLCGAGQTPVVCSAAQPPEPIPAPDSDAGCTLLPIPTPVGQLFYCCPCGAPEDLGVTSVWRQPSC